MACTSQSGENSCVAKKKLIIYRLTLIQGAFVNLNINQQWYLVKLHPYLQIVNTIYKMDFLRKKRDINKNNLTYENFTFAILKVVTFIRKII